MIFEPMLRPDHHKNYGPSSAIDAAVPCCKAAKDRARRPFVAVVGGVARVLAFVCAATLAALKPVAAEPEALEGGTVAQRFSAPQRTLAERLSAGSEVAGVSLSANALYLAGFVSPRPLGATERARAHSQETQVGNAGAALSPALVSGAHSEAASWLRYLTIWPVAAGGNGYKSAQAVRVPLQPSEVSWVGWAGGEQLVIALAVPPKSLDLEADARLRAASKGEGQPVWLEKPLAGKAMMWVFDAGAQTLKPLPAVGLSAFRARTLTGDRPAGQSIQQTPEEHGEPEGSTSAARGERAISRVSPPASDIDTVSQRAGSIAGIFSANTAASTQEVRQQWGPQPSARDQGFVEARVPPGLLSLMPADDAHILVQWEEGHTEGWPAVFEVNIKTGRVRKTQSAFPPVVRWYASLEGDVGMGEGFANSARQLYAPDPVTAWRKVKTSDYLGGPAFVPLYLEPGGETALVLTSHASDTREVWRMQVSSGEFIRKMAGHETYDISSLALSPQDGLMVGASYTASGSESLYLSQAHTRFSADITLAEGADAAVLLGGDMQGRWLLYGLISQDMPRWHALYDTETGAHMSISKPERALYPALDKTSVWISEGGPAMQAVLTVGLHASGAHARENHSGTETKEGAQINALESAAREKKRPAVILIHGGPVSRVDTDFHDLTSFLAASGYTVLAPNFRGSRGYGEAWLKAGYVGWGTVMQDDIERAARWLVRRGYADKDAICTIGGSYGGYSALMAVIKDRGYTACAVSLNGVTSLQEQINHFARQRFARLSVGRIAGDMTVREMRKRSPLYRVRELKRPVLLLHSTNDGTVHVSHSAALAQELAKLDYEYDFIPLEGAEHSLAGSPWRSRYLLEAVNFLGKHIGPETGDDA